MKKHKLAILNTSIITIDGVFELKTITLEEAIELVSSNELDSAIGHENTAQIMSELLGVTIPFNRQLFVQEVGQQALIFKLSGRPNEGQLLTRDEILSMGYDFKVLTRIS